MELNKLLFPAPRPSYDFQTFPGELVWIPNEKGPQFNIPCLYLPFPRGSSKILMYFHGNAEDVGLAYELLDHLRATLMVHVLAIEYPGYGVYPGSSKADRIISDAEHVFKFLTTSLGWNQRDIIIFGRSIGSGPAVYLASRMNPCALLLMSAYTSIRSVVKNIAGRVIQYLVKDRFKNATLMHDITCPTFLVHGQQDNLIPFENSQRLHGLCAGPCSLILPKDMDHNEFDFYEDLSIPFSGFLMQCGIDVGPTPEASFLTILPEMYLAPEIDRKHLPKGRWNKMFRLFK